MKTNGDTPTGMYKILGWRKTGEGTGYSKEIMELKELSQWLESSNETESKGSLTVENDLEAPVSYMGKFYIPIIS